MLAIDMLQGIDWTWLSLDGAMTKAPLGGEKNRPQSYGSRERRLKRSMLTDGQGMPLALAIDGANRHDMKLVRKTLENLPLGRPQPTATWPLHLCIDKGYDFQEVHDLVAEFGLTARICSRRDEAKALRRQVGYRARRWVVERSHSWINRCRGLPVRWAKKAENYLAFLHLACGIITWRASGLLG